MGKSSTMDNLPKHSGLRQFALKWMTPTGLFGLVCLLWLLFRSGSKPSRVVYPCQRAAAAFSLSKLAWLIGVPTWLKPPRPVIKSILALAFIGALIFFAAEEYSFIRYSILTNADVSSAASNLTFVAKPADANATQKSDVFVVKNIPSGVGGYGDPHDGIESLASLMGERGLKLYKTAGEGPENGPNGIIGRDDVVLIKINRVSPRFASTNLDVVRGLIRMIVDHPEGFAGEIVIVENTQRLGVSPPDGNNVNSDNPLHTYSGLVGYWNASNKVSYNTWDDLGDALVGETEHGRDGNVLLEDLHIAYPKFTTAYGTKIDLKHGVWNGTAYDNSKLRMINVPILKTHYYFGATGALKNYIGLLCTKCLNLTDAIHERITDYPLHEGGILGRFRTEVRDADLDILDATKVVYCGGPFDYYDGRDTMFIRTNVLFAGTDAVALDYYSTKHLLYPIIPKGVDCGFGGDWKERADPDNMNESITALGWPMNALHQYLNASAIGLNRMGISATMNEDEISVYSYDFMDNSSNPSGKI